MRIRKNKQEFNYSFINKSRPDYGQITYILNFLCTFILWKIIFSIYKIKAFSGNQHTFSSTSTFQLISHLWNEQRHKKQHTEEVASPQYSGSVGSLRSNHNGNIAAGPGGVVSSFYWFSGSDDCRGRLKLRISGEGNE